MRSVKDYSISADAAQGAMPARGGARPNRRWRVLAPDRGKDRRLSFDNIGLRRDHDTIINPIAGNNSGTSRLKPCAGGCPGEAVDREGADYTSRVYAEDFRETGDVSKTLQSYEAMTIGEIRKGGRR